MPYPKDPDVWQLLFEQTPVLLRGFLGVCTLGIFTLISVGYRWHREDIRAMHLRINHLEDKMDAGFTEMRGYLMDGGSKKK